MRAVLWKHPHPPDTKQSVSLIAQQNKTCSQLIPATWAHRASDDPRRSWASAHQTLDRPWCRAQRVTEQSDRKRWSEIKQRGVSWSNEKQRARWPGAGLCKDEPPGRKGRASEKDPSEGGLVRRQWKEERGWREGWRGREKRKKEEGGVKNRRKGRGLVLGGKNRHL